MAQSATHFWPVSELPDLEVAHVHRTAAMPSWCEYHDTFAVSGVVAGPAGVARLVLAQPGDLRIDAPPPDATAWQVVRIPHGVVEREAGRRHLALRTRTSVERAAIASFAELNAALARSRAGRGLRALLARCIAVLVDACHDGDPQPTAEPVSIQRARTHMTHCLAGTCSLDQLAEAACLGKFQLIKLFQQQCGLPPMKYLMYMRAARARSLLSQGVPCTRVAQESGFYDQSHLNRWFQRVYRLTPGVYLRQRRSIDLCN